MSTTVDPDKVDELASEFKRLSNILEENEIGLYREMLDLIRETNAEFDEGYVRSTTAEMENLLEEIHDLAQSITDRLNNKSQVLNRAAEQYRRDEDAARELLAQPVNFSFDEMLGSLGVFFGQAKKVVSGVVDDVLDACLPDFIEDALYDEPSVNLPLEVAPLKGNLSLNPKVYSAEVKDLQQRLRELGYYVKVDGYFTQQTLAAVNAYKNKHGIANVGENAGVVDNQTWLWLNGGLTGELRLDPEKYSEQVKMAQIRLKDKGYNVEVTGYFDEKTLKAVNAFKDNHRIGNTGKWEGTIGPQTWGVLFDLPSVAIPQAIQASRTRELEANPGTGKDKPKQSTVEAYAEKFVKFMAGDGTGMPSITVTMQGSGRIAAWGGTGSGSYGYIYDNQGHQGLFLTPAAGVGSPTKSLSYGIGIYQGVAKNWEGPGRQTGVTTPLVSVDIAESGPLKGIEISTGGVPEAHLERSRTKIWWLPDKRKRDDIFDGPGS